MRAKEYVFTGERIPADRALEWGLVNRVVARPTTCCPTRWRSRTGSPSTLRGHSTTPSA